MERDTDTNYARAEHDTPVQGNTGNLMTVQSPNCEITPYLDHGIQRVEPAVQLDQKNNDYYLKAMEGYLGNIKTWKHKKLLLTLAEGFVTGLGSFILEATDNGMGVLMILAALLGVVVVPAAMMTKIPPAPPWIEENLVLKKNFLTAAKAAGQVFAGVCCGMLIGIIIAVIIGG